MRQIRKLKLTSGNFSVRKPEVMIEIRNSQEVAAVEVRGQSGVQEVRQRKYFKEECVTTGQMLLRSSVK